MRAGCLEEPLGRDDRQKGRKKNAHTKRSQPKNKKTPTNTHNHTNPSSSWDKEQLKKKKKDNWIFDGSFDKNDAHREEKKQLRQSIFCHCVWCKWKWFCHVDGMEQGWKVDMNLQHIGGQKRTCMKIKQHSGYWKASAESSRQTLIIHDNCISHTPSPCFIFLHHH